MSSNNNSSFLEVSGQEASDILAAALQQMDGIIAGTKFDSSSNGVGSLTSTPENTLKHRSTVTEARILKLVDDLKLALELCDDKQRIIRKLPDDVLSVVISWLQSGKEEANKMNGYMHESAEDRIRRLEIEKNGLALQVSVLTEQVEAQGERLREMEYQLDEKRQKVHYAEDMYQNELLTRSSLETHKLDLMAEISSLKIRLATAENERRELEERLKQSQRQITDLEARLALKDAETADLRQKLARNGTVVSDVNVTEDCMIEQCQGEKERTLDRLRKKQYEVERLKKAVDALMTSNAEKDKRLEELRRILRRYKKIEELVAQAQGRKMLDEILGTEDDTSSTSSTTPSVTNDTTRTTDTGPYQMDDHKGLTNYSISPSATSTPVNSFSEPRSNLTSPPSTIASVKPTRRIQRSNSAEEITKNNHKTPPANKRHTDVVKRNGSYGTLPKEMIVRNKEDDREHRRSRGFPSFGRALLRIKSTKRSCSAPNLAQAEAVTDDEDPNYVGHSAGTYHPEVKKKKGFLRFFGRLKRSGSQDFHERERTDEFKRGGIRATATARLGWSKDIKREHDLSVPFSRWDRDRIVSWFNEIGLNMYLAELRRWCRNGDQLLKASPHELEKELNIRNPLHRKKLQLALQAMSSGNMTKAGELDHTWVMRWLDDIGLPQYKDAFFDARVDGRMLHALTVEDLLSLKVSNELHHISIKRGIQILRLNNFSPACLKRRPSPDEGTLHNIPGDVALWTNHRVMEWLRTIDLSEYAPNMRGSGVHGALMVLESRFNAELFAVLLSIPHNKTLLRRHLNTHFVSLVGNEIQIKKREQESSQGYVPLVPNAKVKKGKFGLFGHKRSKSETEADGFICPLDLALPLDKLKISALQYQGKENQLGKESFFDSVPSSNV
ncbi:liprin-beta-1-like isoform X3 [Mercenaria mercenaria]|uniref:liprin-beta-1-like isoform X3 n=1 Tax=Mercenaria mercenaria TaxID=6596 RepID=UPI001E1E06B6|nr:liprin-beta-1-like isoform X3 [Mercenaria mercenaria]